MRISDDPLAQPSGGNLKPIWVQKMFFVLNFTSVIFLGPGTYVIWYYEGYSFAEILGFSNIFGFPVVNWTPKWTKTLGVFHLSQNSKFWRIFQIPPGIFKFFNLPLKIPGRAKLHLLEIPQNCVKPLRNSKV